MAQQTQSQFHAAEVAVQARLGVAEHVAEYSRGFIRSKMPMQHRDFFSELPFVILGIVDKKGYPWTIPLFGQPGFIQSPDDTRLDLHAVPNLVQLLNLDFTPGQKIGMLGIQLDTRRRNRMNGLIHQVGESGFSIHVEQSFGNCPQYIQTRALDWKPVEDQQKDFADIKVADHIDALSQTLVEKADTFFISSRTKVFDADTRTGIDASHRGGKPGFVKVDGKSLYFPDFSGNRFFNTLGNIESDGRVGLLFPDFSSRNALFITGNAQIHWQHEGLETFEGAERIIEVRAEKIVHIPQYLPLGGELVERSPALDETGTWKSAAVEKPGYQPFTLVKKQKENDTITSFYLAPENGSTEDYRAGQFLPIELTLPNQVQPIKRNYTLSQAPGSKYYRISVKRESQGLASRALHDLFEPGDMLKAGRPSGQFTLQPSQHPRVFISAGVGITPMLAMLESLVDESKKGIEPKPLWFIHATQNSGTQAFSGYLNQLAEQYSWLHVHTVFSRPLVTDVFGPGVVAQTHQSEGRISISLLKNILPVDEYDFYLCGPENFMRSVYAGLVDEGSVFDGSVLEEATGVSRQNIFYEFFGEGSIEERDDSQSIATAERADIHFAKTGTSGEWTPEEGSLLDFAEKQSLNPAYSCRSGSCGACACSLRSGSVVYPQKTAYVPEEGEILLCQARPAKNSTALVIDI